MEVARSDHAIVLRAWQPAFERSVGVRLLPGTGIGTLEAGFRRAGALAGHPNVVTVHGFGVTGDGVPYLVTELLEQGSLADRVARSGPLDWYEAVAATVKVAGVLEAAAEAGVDRPRVGPGDVLLSRFGEPKVAVVGGPPSPAGDEVEALRSLLRALAGGDPPAGLGPALDGPVAGVDDLVRRLQRAQAGAGRPVTELPRASRAATPTPSADVAGFSEAVTVAPPLSPSGRGRRQVAAAALAVVVAMVTVVVVLNRRPSAPPVTAPASPAGTTPVPVTGPIDPPIHTHRLGGPAAAATGNLVDGELRIRIEPPGRTVGGWSTRSGEHRLSVSVTARLFAGQPAAQLGVVCGVDRPGEKHLTAWVSAGGGWQIEATGEVVGRGSAPERQAELLETFVLRLDCVTDRSPTSATLFLNGTALGRADGRDPFPMAGSEFMARASGVEGFDLGTRDLTVRRLG